MGKRGPIAAKKDRLGEPCVPKVPTDIPASVKAVWRRIVPKIEPEILRAVDQTALADMCFTVMELELCRRQVVELGPLVEGDRGWVKNPACQLERQYRDALQRWSQRFGLSPWDRDRIDMPPAPDGDDAFDAYLRGGDGDEEDAQADR